MKSECMKSENLSQILCKQCCICGKGFGVKINRDGLIVIDCWYNKLDTNFFDGWMWGFDSKILKKEHYLDDKYLKIIYKNKFYKIIGFSNWSREVYYFLWKIFHKKEILEIWECPKCANRPDDI